MSVRVPSWYPMAHEPLRRVHAIVDECSFLWNSLKDFTTAMLYVVPGASLLWVRSPRYGRLHTLTGNLQDKRDTRSSRPASSASRRRHRSTLLAVTISVHTLYLLSDALPRLLSDTPRI